MAKSQRVEMFEIPTEQLSYVPGPHGDRWATLGRWSGTWRSAVGTLTRPAPTAAASAGATPRPIGDASTTFRRMVEVPGPRLAVVLGAWWQQSDHDDDHLHLGVPRPVGDAWSLSGRFRRTLLSRWLPVELLLSPYHGRWTLLELMPRRQIHPGRVYYREGHRSIDGFVAAIRTQERLTRGRRWPAGGSAKSPV
jgi:hypothetical protein